MTPKTIQTFSYNIFQPPRFQRGVLEPSDHVNRIWFNQEIGSIRPSGYRCNKETLSDSRNLCANSQFKESLSTKMDVDIAWVISKNAPDATPLSLSRKGPVYINFNIAQVRQNPSRGNSGMNTEWNEDLIWISVNVSYRRNFRTPSILQLPRKMKFENLKTWFETKNFLTKNDPVMAWPNGSRKSIEGQTPQLDLLQRELDVHPRKKYSVDIRRTNKVEVPHVDTPYHKETIKLQWKNVWEVDST